MGKGVWDNKKIAELAWDCQPDHTVLWFSGTGLVPHRYRITFGERIWLDFLHKKSHTLDAGETIVNGCDYGDKYHWGL